MFDEQRPGLGAMTVDDGDAAFAASWAAVVRAVEAVQQALATRLESAGISAQYFSVLTLLLESEDRRMPMSRIARDLSMTSGGFTKLADRMARDGLIDRRGSSGDRRVVFAALTDDGLELARKAVVEYHAFLHDEVLGVVSAEELRRFAETIGRLGGAHEPAEPEPPAFEISERAPDEPERRAHDDLS